MTGSDASMTGPLEHAGEMQEQVDQTCYLEIDG